MKKKKKSPPALESTAEGGLLSPPPRSDLFAGRWPIGLLLVVLLSLLFASRFYSLESQGFHHDESIHCLHSWDIANKGAQTYKYNPVYHGPFLYHFGALFHSFVRPAPLDPNAPARPLYQTLAPDEDWVGRVPFALVGSLFILGFLLLRRHLGWGTVLLIVAFLTLSPVVNYFSRFARNDAYMTAWLSGMIVCGFLYFKSRRSGYLVFIGLFAVLSYCTKENSYINTFAPCSFLILWGIFDLLRSPRKTLESICLDFAPLVRFLILFGCASVFVFLFVALDSRIGPSTGLWQGTRNILAHSTALTEKIDASALKGETGFFTAAERGTVKQNYFRFAFGVTLSLLILFEGLVFLVRKAVRKDEPLSAQALRAAFAVLFIAVLAGGIVNLSGWVAVAEREGFLGALFARMALQALGFGFLALLFAIPARLANRGSDRPLRLFGREVLDWWNLALIVTVVESVYLFLFTSMGTNIQRGASAGLYDYIAYWFKHQTGDFRIWGAWWYYLPRLLLYELLPIVLALIVGIRLLYGAVRSFLSQKGAAIQGVAVSPSAKSEGGEIDSIWWKPVPAPLLCYAIYQFFFMAALYAILNEKVPWLMTYQSFAIGLLAALLLGHYFATHPNSPGPFVGFFWDLFSPPPGLSKRTRIGRGLTAALVVLLLPFAFGQHLAAVFVRPDHPTELLLYTGTTNQFADQIERIRDMRKAARAEGRRLSIAVDGKSEWPTAWYFRNDDVRWRSVDLTRDIQILDDTPQNRQRMKPNRGHVWEIVPCNLRGWWIWHGTPTALPGRLALLPNLKAFLFNENNDQRRVFPPETRPEEKDYTVGFRSQILRYVFGRRIWYPSAGEKILVGYRTDEMVSEEESAGYIEGVYDPPLNLAPARVWGATRSEQGEFAQPRGLAFDPNGLLAIVDSKKGVVRLLNPEGATVRVLGEGVLSPEVTGPCGVAFDSAGHLYVADTWNHSIKKFSPEGALLASFESVTQGQVHTRLFGPRGLAVGPEGRVFVTDTGNHCVRVFDPDLKLLQTLGGPGSEPGRFKEPVGIVIDSKDRILVADAGNGRIQRLDTEGRFDAEFLTLRPTDSEVSALEPNLAILHDGRLAYSYSREDAVWILDTERKVAKKYTIAPPRLRGPVGLAVAPNGRLWVSGRDSGTVAEVRIP